MEGVGEGKGLYIYPDGSYYEGGIKNGKAEGKGKFVFRNEELVYEGNWQYDRPNGYGVEKIADGSEYRGNFVKGIKQGEGIFTWTNGDRYNGNFS